MSMQNMVPVGQSGWMGTLGPGEGDARGRFILDSDRFKSLDRKQSYFDCIAHGERVVLADGRELPIESVSPGSSVQAINHVSWNHVPSALVDEAVRTGRDGVLRLQTRSGRVFRVSDRHPLLAATETFGWTRAGRLSVGDHLACARWLVPGCETDWSRNEAQLLGYLVGDGSCGRGYFGFTQKTSEEVSREFRSVAGASGWEVVQSPSARWQMRVKGNGALRFIEKSGLAHVRSRQKFVPAGVFGLPSESIAAFLGALWDCDGSVNENIALALLSTTSAHLARDVQSLLLRLGIWSSIRPRDQGEHSYGQGLIWAVEVSGTDLRRFAALVPLAHHQKAARLRAWLLVPTSTPGTDIVPSAWQNLLGGEVPSFVAPSGNIGRVRLERLAERRNNGILHALATSDVRWDKITEIRRDGEDWLYDLTVPGPSSFVVGGTYVHNCTQHDLKKYDFDGHIINANSGGVVQANQPLIGEKAGYYVPLRARRPSTPYRLPRVITTSFTGLLFGDQRFPTLAVPTDPKSQDFAQCISMVASLPVRMIQARNLGGSMGTACLSWAYVDGKPRARVHNAKYIHIHEWEDRDEFIPRHAIECYQFTKQEWDPAKRRLVTVTYWHRRDWLPNLDLVFLPTRVRQGIEPVFIPDFTKSVQHNDRLAHLVWIQNLPSDDIDGHSDYEGLYDNFDTLDCMLSVLTKGAILNLDPTVVLKLDPDAINSSGVRKGSETALVVGEDGDAKYMELVGSSLAAGINLFNRKRETTLEVAQCVLLDPDKAAAQGVSSVAQKMIYTPMLGKADILREQYGSGLKRLMEPMLVVAQRASKNTVIVIDPETFKEVEERQIVILPPKVKKTPSPVPGEDDVIEFIPRVPGDGTEVDPQWPPYFQPTPQDKQMLGAMLFQGSGQRAFIPIQTAVEEAAKLFGRAVDAEWIKMQSQQDEAEGKQNQMFADATGAAGGKVQHTTPLAGGGQMTRTVAPPPPPSIPGAPPPSESSESSESPPIPITPAAVMGIITVNEARKSLGLEPMPEPDGHLSLAAFQAKYANPIAQAANAQLGKVGTAPAGAPPAAPGGGQGGPPKSPPKPPTPGGPPGATGAPPGPPGAATAPKPPVPAGPAPAAGAPPGPPKPPGGMPPKF